MSAYNVTVNGVTYRVHLVKRDGQEITFTIDGESYDVNVNRPVSETRGIRREPLPSPQTTAGPRSIAQVSNLTASAGEVTAPIPGILSSIKVSLGDQVSVGDTVAIVEAMKMENPIRAHCNGKVTHLYGKAGDEVKVGTALIKIDNSQ